LHSTSAVVNNEEEVVKVPRKFKPYPFEVRAMTTVSRHEVHSQISASHLINFLACTLLKSVSRRANSNSRITNKPRLRHSSCSFTQYQLEHERRNE
jgi:hypothetical protein